MFALVNLPEVVKAPCSPAIHGRPSPVRRLFLDEFMADPESGIEAIASTGRRDPVVDQRRAEDLYRARLLRIWR